MIIDNFHERSTAIDIKATRVFSDGDSKKTNYLLEKIALNTAMTCDYLDSIDDKLSKMIELLERK